MHVADLSEGKDTVASFLRRRALAESLTAYEEITSHIRERLKTNRMR